MSGEVLRPIAIRTWPARQRAIAPKYIAQSLAAVVAFIVATILLGQMIPSPTIPSNVVFIGPKNDYYQAHKDDYNALFFGSSRVYNQIVPDVFDTSARSAGIAVNSYNFGIPAMRALDSTVLLEDALGNPPANLEWVFFETILDKGYEPIPNARTQRAMYWHTWKNTGLAARYILMSEASMPEKAVLLVSHLLPALYRQMNVGRLFDQILPSEFSAEERQVAEQFTAAEGYAPLVDDADPKRQAFLETQAEYAAQVASLTTQSVEPTDLELALAANKQMLLAKVTQIIRAAGAEPIFIEPPSLDPDRDFRTALAQGEIDTLLAYKDPQRFPQLYQADQRFDADHLNAAAAREFSRLLAQDFAKSVQPR
ncbi:MAG: hypothetical protein WA883_21485 [Phormidesmis sp.]